LDLGRSIIGLCMIFGCMDWIVLVIFGDIFYFKSNIFQLFFTTWSHGHYYRALVEIFGAFKAIISLLFQPKSYVFLSFPAVEK
jgi:hypothetical protein